MIEKLSRYIKSSGKDYQDHYVTILNWYEQDKDKLSKKGKNKSYTTQDYDKGEYLLIIFKTTMSVSEFVIKKRQ